MLERLDEGGEYDGDILAMLTTCNLDTLDIWNWNRHLPPDRQIESKYPAHCICDLVTHPRYRRMGFGTAIVRNVLHNGRHNGLLYDRAYVLSKVPASGDTEGTSFGLLTTQLLFEERGRIKTYFRTSENFSCPACCPEPCQCEARILEWRRKS
jgi:ribosomal protein S18 acetylase RimI-like enzyme